MSYVGSFVRHGLTFIGGWLVAHGAEPQAVDAIVGPAGQITLGVLSYLLAQWFSIKDKKER